MDFPDSSAGKESTCNAWDPGLIPGLGRSPGEGIRLPTPIFLSFPHGSDGKESTCNVGYLGSIFELERSPGGGHGNPLQYSCLENPHGQRSLVGYSPWGCRVRHNWVTKHTYNTYRTILFIHCIWLFELYNFEEYRSTYTLIFFKSSSTALFVSGWICECGGNMNVWRADYKLCIFWTAWKVSIIYPVFFKNQLYIFNKISN